MYNTLINAAELQLLLTDENVVIIDCRFDLADTESGRKAYEESHIPGAVYAHLDDDLSGEIIPGKTGRHPFPDAETLASKLSKWGIDHETQVAIYDQSHGGIAARLWFLLKWLGHEKAAVLNGGWQYWVKNNFTTSADLPTPTPKNFQPKPNPKLLVDVHFMEENLGNPEFIYLDSRAAERYRGEVEPIDPVAGHIPGAIAAPFLENLDEEGLFLNKEKLAKRFLTILKNQPKGKAVFYCGSGVTACHNLLAMNHLGLTSPKLFPGSWSEWIVDEQRPIATGEQP